MKLLETAVAGTLESSDVQIMVSPNPKGGNQIELESVVKLQFGKDIFKTVENILAELNVTDSIIRILDKGAFDNVIRARLTTALLRSAKQQFNWKG